MEGVYTAHASSGPPVLLVEDDEVDVMMARRAFDRYCSGHRLEVASDGDAALERLRAGLRPMFIILDLNMPGLDGIGLLRELKRDPLLAALPAVVLTSSSQQSDRAAAYDFNAAGFFVKPVDYEAFVQLVQVICRYWEASRVPVQ